MATANPDTIKIIHDEPEDGREIYTLYVDGGPRAKLAVRKRPKQKPEVTLDILFAGEFDWAEAGVWVRALQKLADIGDKLAGDSTDVERLLHKQSEEEIEMAAKKKAAKAKKANGKSRQPGEKRESAAQMFQDLIMEGKKTDDQIFAAVKAKYKLDDKKRSYVAWYRNKLTKDGKKPPAAKE